MNIKQQFATLQARIDALSLRERGMVFFAILALLYMAWSSLLIAPAEKAQKSLLAEIGTVRQEIATLERQSLEIINRSTVDPDAADRRQLSQLEQANEALQDQIAEAVEGLVAPQQMAAALESVLKRQKNLTFVRLENLGASPLISGGEAAGGDAGIYKHTMRLELEGSYNDTLGYLRALEALPWRFHWESVSMEMIDYPRARVVLTVNTLSLSEGWIGV